MALWLLHGAGLHRHHRRRAAGVFQATGIFLIAEPRVELVTFDAALPESVLAAFGFGAAVGDDPRRIAIPLQPLTTSALELWIGEGSTDAGQTGDAQFIEDGQLLFGQLRLDAQASNDIDSAGFEAYRQLDGFIAGCGYPHLLRTWNFFDRLNQGVGDEERYKRFCVGRHRAIAIPGFESRLPAASVIGTQTPGLIVCFLAGKQAGIQIENPRQVSAFRYPRGYGPRSPSFSRATLCGRTLFVSGTAAIVGHETQHVGDALAQLHEIVANIRALLDAAAAAARPFIGESGGWAAQALRLYLRDPAALHAVLPELRKLLGEDTPLIALQGDISRSDLLLEIEGVWRRL